MIRSVTLIALLSTALSLPAIAANRRIDQADSFRIGSSGVECSAQSRSSDASLKSMFDRAYSVVCRDAAAEVGKLYMVKASGGAGPVGLAALTCEASAVASLPDVSGATRTMCEASESGLRYVQYRISKGARSYLAEGLAGYDSAIVLGFRAIVLDRQVPGAVEVVVTEAGDPTAFARVQAGNLDPDQALSEGYARNNTGNFPEAAEFFDTLLGRAQSGLSGFARAAEYSANQALQLSNLGKFAEADALFASATKGVDPSDPVLTRLLRNYQMIHALNQQDGKAALLALRERLGTQSSGGAAERLNEGYLDRPIVQRLNSEEKRILALGGGGGRLSVTERTQLLDAQARHLQGAAFRLLGQNDEAKKSQTDSVSRVMQVRSGKVASAIWLRGGALSELATLSEIAGDPAKARTQLSEAVELYQKNYPGSAALTGVQARLAALLARTGSTAEARTLFRQTVESSAGSAGASANVRGYLPAYFDLLTAADGGAAEDFFAASQMLVRPGIAQTQAVFARELSGGSDDAARMFRQSLNQSRDIVRLDGDIARMAAVEEQSAEMTDALSTARARRTALGASQTALLSTLAQFPKFRAVADGQTGLSALQAALKPGEGYYKLVLTAQKAYAFFATAAGARVFVLPITPETLSNKVAALRDTIAKSENGEVVIEPFNVVMARALYLDLFAPIAADVAGLSHFIFEPDGPMLQLPVNLLVADQAGVDAYIARGKSADADPYDFRGVAWLGRKQIVTTAVSPKAFIDVRSIAPSRASKAYLGLGENTEITTANIPVRPADDCAWPLGVWGRPISSDELRFASGVLGVGRSDVVTKDGFTDVSLSARSDLNNFRILHFATHGLVTSPSPACPARPALVTSFAPANSDGLLSFREIFDLRLDADLVVLSACDTAGAATAEATRDAGISTGGNFALDGLVRAFVAAGARSVIATHWPVPDEFDATKTLITGLFSARKGEAIGNALQRAQIGMMDRADTSHPYYWSAFAVIGDASKAVIEPE